MSDNHSNGLDRLRLSEAVTHDLNNLLTAVNGSAEQLGLALPRNEPARVDVDEIHEAVGDAAILVKLMDQGSWNSEPAFEDLDLSAILRVGLNLIRKMLPRSVDIRLDRLSPETTARGDAVRVLRVLLGIAAWIGARLGDDGVLVLSATSSKSETILRLAGAPSFGGDEEELPAGLVELAWSIKGSIRGSSCRWDVVLPNPAALDRERESRRLGIDHILIAEEDDLLRSFLVSSFEEASPVLACEAKSLFVELERSGSELGLALVALTLSDFDPNRDYQRIRKLHPSLPLVFFSENGTAANQLSALLREDSQAILLIKPFSISQLMAAITKMIGVAQREAR